jgi:hypothetical protein
MIHFRKLLLGMFVPGLIIGLVLIGGGIFGEGKLSAIELEELHKQLLPLFALPGVVYTDVLEDEDRFEIGVVSEKLFRGVEKELKRLGVRRDKVDIVVTRPILPMTTLRDYVRPLEGGLQVAFSKSLCTLGFNAVRSGVGGFVVNSHCTDEWGKLDGTDHYQPLVAEANFIGSEIVDPPFFRRGACPRGWECRWSDTAYSQRASGVTANLGLLSRTDSVNTGSVNVVGNFRIVSEATGNATVGEVVNKVGRTTGWSQGQVTRSCVNTAVFGTNRVFLCQDWVNARVGSGDSGSPVFRIANSPLTNDVSLYGVLWGGTSDGTTFVYSPMANVQRFSELGPLNNCASGFSC